MDTNLFIEHQCPQCGAPADLKETDRIVDCEYCRVKSYLFSKDVFRYLLPSRAPENAHLIYVPYWRFKGMLFSSLESGIVHRFVDMSHQAVRSRYFPVSVGLRSQALKLRFASPDTPGVFLTPALSFDSVMDIFVKRANRSLQGEIFHQAHIGEALSLIYSPFYAKDKLYDAVLNRPITSGLPKDFDIEAYPAGDLAWRIRFLPTLCPDCGWDLSGERDALGLVCRNCNSLWQPAKSGLEMAVIGVLSALVGYLVGVLLKVPAG